VILIPFSPRFTLFVSLESSPRSVSSPRLVSQESSTIIEGTREVTSGDQISLFRGCVLEGRWEYVIPAYRNYNEYHKIRINESRGTALHVVVNDGKVELVNTLVGAILSHEGREVVRGDSALRSTDERGDTPLHLAASRGFTSTKYENNDPLFSAALRLNAFVKNAVAFLKLN